MIRGHIDMSRRVAWCVIAALCSAGILGGSKPAAARVISECVFHRNAERAALRQIERDYTAEIASLQRQIQLTRNPTPGVVDREYAAAAFEVTTLKRDVNLDKDFIVQLGSAAGERARRVLAADEQALQAAYRRLDFWAAQRTQNELGINIAIPKDYISSMQSRLAELQSQKSINAQEIGYITGLIALCPTPKPQATPAFRSEWNGTYVGGGHTVTLTQSSATELSGSATWTSPGETHETQGSTETYTGCRISGSQSECKKVSGSYWDPDKTIDYVADITFTLSGDQLTISSTITNDAKPAWKNGDKGYTASIRKGAKFGVTLRRQ